MNHTESIILGIVVLLALMLVAVLNRKRNPELENKEPSTRPKSGGLP